MKNYTVSDFKSVTPIYTGGNIYVFFGQLQDGSYLMSDSCVFYVRFLSADPLAAGDDAFYEDWQIDHLLRDIEDEEETLSFVIAMCDWVLQNGDEKGYIDSEIEAIKNEAESLKGTTDWR